MPRRPRLLVPDGIYHVTARGNEQRLIYLDANDRRRFLAELGDVVAGHRWLALGYCLMSTHYHLLVQTPEANLPDGMRDLNGVYAQTFNRRHGRVGHLFQGRYGARFQHSDEQLASTVRYIVRNPVRDGLCRHPGGWRWSSYRAVLGDAPALMVDVDALLRYYDSDPAIARRLFREDAERPDPPELPEDRPASRPPLSALLGHGAAPPAILAARDRGYSLRAIARYLGVNVSTVSRRLERDAAPSRTATPGV